jgi:hypothetical protein
MSFSDALGSIAAIGAVALGGFIAWKVLGSSGNTTAGNNAWTLPNALGTGASATAAGWQQGQQYATSPAAWGGSAGDVWTLAGNTQAVITRGIAAVAAPVTYSVNALASWVGGWL